MRKFLLGVLFVFCSGYSFAQITSIQDGDWDDPGTWDCACVPDALSFQTITVDHDVTITNDITLNLVTITSGSVVTINSGVTIFIEEDFTNTPLIIDAGGTLINNGTLDLESLLFSTAVQVFGTLQNSADINIVDPSLLVFNGGSTYRHSHATGGDIPLVTWDVNSTVEVSGLTNADPLPPNNLDQTFGNFTWNTPSMGPSSTTFSLAGELQAVTGDLRLVSTGNPARIVRFADASAGYTLTIGGDIFMQGGVFFLTQSMTSATVIDLEGSFDMTGGTLNCGITNTQNITFQIAGNFNKSGGTLSVGSGIGIRNILFDGPGTDQSYSVNALVTASALLFTVQAGSVLDLGTSPIVTSGTTGAFTCSGTLKLGSLSGTGALGANVPIATRTFNSGSRIVYNGSAPQFIGISHPPTPSVVTEIDNAGGVTLASNVTIGGNLVLTNGNLSVATNTLTFGANATLNSNSINVVSGSSFVFNGTGPFGTLVTSGSATINNFTINRPSAGSVTLGSSLTIGGTFTQTVGDIILNGQTLTISGDYARTNGNLNGDAAASLIVDGTGALPAAIQFSGTQALNTLTVNRSSSTFATSSTLTLTNLNLLSGTFNNGGTITMNDGGVLTRTEGSILSNKPTTNPTTNAYNVVYDIANDISSGAEIPALPTQLRNVTKTGGAALTLTEPLTINGVLTLTNGNFNASTFAIDLKGNFVANSTSTLTSSPFTFSGTSTISGGSIVQFGAVNITGSLTPTINIRIDGNLVNDGTLNAGTGSQTVTFGGTTTISGGSVHNFNAVTVAGTLTAPSSMNVAGNFTFSSGTFTSSNGTVVFNGTSSISGAPSFHNVTVTGTLNGPTNLNVTGDLALNGVFNSGSGRITFNGTANQRIDRTSGSATTINLFDVTVNKANGTFNIASTVANTIFRVQNEFTIAQAGANTPDIDFDGPSNTGTFVLGSSSTRTAKITAVPAGTQIVGNLTVERFVQNADGIRNWRYLSSPVVGATVADWQGEIQITGQFSNPSTGAGITNPNNPSLYRYTETLGGLFNARYERWPNNISLPASSFALENGRGYSVFVRDTGTPTINVRGTLRFGDVGIALTSTGSEPDAAGFNLVGNPYPAPINWDLVTLPGGVSSTISMIDNVSNGGLGGGQFVYYVQGLANVGTFTGDIGSGQAFWVETTSGTTLTFSESHKSSEINPVIVREKQIANLLRIKVEGNGKKDETVVYFKDKATDNYDLRYDARKRENEFINLFTHSQSDEGVDKYAINGLQAIDCSREILLGLEKFTEGTYTFLFSEMESFDNGYEFRLIDNFAGTSVSVNDQAYVFTVTNNPASYGFERFKVIISEGAIESNLAVLGDKKCDSKNLQITLGSSQEGISYQPFYNGAVVGDPMIGNGNSLTLALKQDVFAPGLAEVSVKAFNACGELFLDQKASIEVAEFEEAAIEVQGNTLVSNYPNGNQWFVDGVEIPGANGQSLDAAKSGEYTLVVTTGECSTSAERSFVITGNETSFSSSVRVYPNTFKQKFSVEVESSAPVHARVFSTMGVMVAEQQLNGSDTLKSGEFDLTGTSDGMYILYIHKGNAVHQVKIIKSAE